jgi:DNA-binding PadR family transcriptional regulator
VHVTLYRLEDKGFIKSSMGGGTNERGGRRKRIYTITSAGMATLKMMKETRLDLWKLVPQLKISGT